jgi:DNA topoisomerase-1
VLIIGLNRAVVLLAEPASPGRRGPQLLRDLGEHPKGGTVALYRGRYGPYVGHDGIIASLPKSADPNTFSLEEAVPLLAAQRAKGKGRQRKSGRSGPAKASPRRAVKAADTGRRATADAAKKAGKKKPETRSGAPPG